MTDKAPTPEDVAKAKDFAEHARVAEKKRPAPYSILALSSCITLRDALTAAEAQLAERDARIAEQEQHLAAWGITAAMVEQEAVRDAARIAALEAEVKGLRIAVELFQSHGCPACNGDCGSANPPVMVCPMQVARAALVTP